MNSSKDALKRKVNELQKQAEEIEELGVELLEKAQFEVSSTRGGYFIELDYKSPLKKLQREVIIKYQQWYTMSLHLVDEFTPEWVDSFKYYYKTPSSSLSLGVWEYLNLWGYSRFETRERAITEFVNGLEAQLATLLSIPSVLEVKEMGLRELITADVARTEIEQAELLLESGFERAAGSIAGVALELHLKTLCDINGVSYKPKPTIEPLIQALYNAKKLDITKQKHLQYLASIRNKCSHSEPITVKEVQRLIDEVKKYIKKSGKRCIKVISMFDILRNLKQKSRMRLLKNVEDARYNHEYAELLVRFIHWGNVAGIS